MKKQLLAPNGKPSNLTPKQYKLVRTPAFKKWFGDWENDPTNASKVVDTNGEPLEVYHGTEYEFNIFDGGAYFTDDYMNADGYASGENVFQTFLNIKKPLIFNANRRKWDNLNSKYGSSTQEIVSNLDEKKYDGVIFKNINDNWFDDKGSPQNVYYAINPNQIKLADESNTTFDGNNPDIRFNKGGIIKIDGNIFKVKLYLGDHSYDNETGKETPMWFFRVYKMNGNDVNGILTEDNNLEGTDIGNFDSRKKAKDFLLKYSEELNVILLDDNGIGIKFFNNNNPDIRFDDGGVINTGLLAQIWGWFGIKF